MEEIVYFELNDWFRGRDYPDAKPFTTWMISGYVNDKLHLPVFRDDNWCKENELCVATVYVDMSQDFLIAAKKSWVEKNCPELLTKYTQFIRTKNEDGFICGQFGHEFPEYTEDNYGTHYIDEDNKVDDWDGEDYYDN